MKRDELTALLARIRSVRAAIVGDFCLDAYLLVDPSRSEASLETSLATRPVRTQRYSPGGAANVAANLRSMGVEHIALFGVVGADPFAGELLRLLGAAGIDTSGLLVQREEWDTHVYIKPFEHEREQHRIDFGAFNALHAAVEHALMENLEAALPSLDIVILKQQVACGVHTEAVRRRLCALAGSSPGRLFITDSRHFADAYGRTIRRLPLGEAARIAGAAPPGAAPPPPGEVEGVCRSLFARWGAPVFVTLEDQGCAVIDTGGYHEIPPLLILSPVDPVGAGDSMLAGIAAALGAGGSPAEAAELGSVVAGVTARKLLQTGTATPEEIIALGEDSDRRYRPDLARESRRAVYAPGTDIEIVSAPPARRRFTHVIFDNDGTLSTLREGWERIMEPMMVRAILGEKDPDAALEEHVRAAVRDFIDRTTGIQTLVQMQGLAGLVRRFRCVPERDILDAHGYKRVYNEALLAMVNDRLGRMERGELSASDFMIRGALPFLEALRARGLTLYLASGTDQEDVEREAAVLGYRELFGDRVFGSVGDVTREAKRIVLERIHAAIGEGASDRVLTFGDGPVELRETHKRGGYTVGIASDEIRRWGLNVRKRRRLIEAGADLVISDFSQGEKLLAILFPR